jgi:peptidase E
MGPTLDRYAGLSGARSPRVCFAPTASADDPTYVKRFLVAYGTLGIRPQVLTLWEDARHSIERLAEADVVVVGGGSTVNLMALWTAHGVHRAIAKLAHEDGKVLLGVSAGACAWHEACITDSFGGADLAPWVGLVTGSFCPTATASQSCPAYVKAVSSGAIPGGYAADDGAAVHYVDGEPTEFLAESPGARVYRVAQSIEPGTSGILVEPQRMTAI